MRSSISCSARLRSISSEFDQESDLENKAPATANHGHGAFFDHLNSHIMFYTLDLLKD